MTDIFSKSKRSAVMAAIRGCGNKDTELRMITIFREYGIVGWRRKIHVFGKPDFVFPSARIALFVDGCFWHCCPKHATTPATNGDFWKAKLARNKARDREVTRKLREVGWIVLRVWECELTLRQRKRTAARIIRTLSKKQKLQR